MEKFDGMIACIRHQRHRIAPWAEVAAAGRPPEPAQNSRLCGLCDVATGPESGAGPEGSSQRVRKGGT
jgi:hypothetical protein